MGKLFFPKIAAGNLVRNRRFFFPYLLTGLLTVAMFYNVAFLTWNKDLKEMPGGDTLTIIMYFGTIVVGIFAVVFLLYTNSFLVKRRQKELGLYNILGMSKGHIAVVMLWETLYTGLITIAGGLLLGILLSKLLMLLLFKILFFTVQFGFVVNAFPVVVTVVLFAGIYLLALAKNLLHVRLSKPVELLKGSNVGEREPKTKKLLVALGVLTLGAGYAIAITVKSPLDALTLFFLAVILVIVGTYCLFTAGSIAMLKGMKRRKNYYYQPKHFIGISGMLYRMKQNSVGLANICILSTMVLVMLSTCVCMYMGVDNAMKTLYPHDITVSQPWIDQKNHSKEESRKLVLDTTKKTGLTPTSIQEIDTIRTVVESKDTSVFLPADREASASDLIYAEAITAESYAHITGEKFSLESGEVALYTTEKDADWKEISFLDTPFQIVKKLEEPPMVGGGGYSDHKIVLVVANETVLEQIYQQQFQYPDSITSNVYWELSMDFETASNQEIEALYGDLRQMNAELEGNYLFDCRPAQSTQFYSLYGGLLFLGIFLGALFLMATVLIIYYKQISEGYDDKERFAIMEKVGMSQQQVRSAIRSQVRTVFFLPLVGAVIHLAAAFKMITKLMAALSLTNIPLFALTCLGTVAVFAVGYLVIYALTARTYYKIVR